jgi:peptide-methionine (S)-S-oxide reductase
MLLSGFAISCDSLPRSPRDVPAPQTVPAATQAAETGSAVLAGGCFWCVEAVFEELDGVSDVISGYAGGTRESANYDQVSEGRTNHAEVVQIKYDPSKITFAQLLRVFFATHDPTTKDRQGPDWGRQYRSAVFYENEDQKRIAESYIRQIESEKIFPAPIVTTLEPLSAFYAAEQYHQDFMKRNPGHPYIQQWAVPKVKKTREKFADQLKR